METNKFKIAANRYTSELFRGELESVPPIQEHLINMFRAKESELIKEVLIQLLKREPHTEDAQNVERRFLKGETGWYVLFYKGVELGKVTYSFNDMNPFTFANNMKITFTPHKDFE